jgi:Mg2+ and Co2+ transporter CorA
LETASAYIPLIIEDILSVHQRPKVDEFDNMLYNGIAHAVLQ